jgi:uncharacterized protein
MKPRIHVITLAVSDLERALEFYRDGLGLESPGVMGTEFVGDDKNPNGAVAMFKLGGGVILALWPRTELAKDAKIRLGAAKSGEFSIGHAVASRAEVDRLMSQAQAAGATLTDDAHDRSWVSTRAISATSMVTCGKSCGTPRSPSRPCRRATTGVRPPAGAPCAALPAGTGRTCGAGGSSVRTRTRARNGVPHDAGAHRTTHRTTACRRDLATQNGTSGADHPKGHARLTNASVTSRLDTWTATRQPHSRRRV